MSIITKPILLDETGQRIAAACEALAAAQALNLYNDWRNLRSLCRSGRASTLLAVGDHLRDSWTDVATDTVYEKADWHLGAFATKTFEDATTASGVVIQQHWAHPFSIQFSHQRAFLRCPSGLAAGTYYFTIESSLGTHVSAGDVVCFTTSMAVPAGGRISGCYGAPDAAKSSWRIYTHSADGKTVIETITPTFTASGTNLGTMKSNTRNGDLNSCQEMAYGWNRWKTSAIRQYLNSDAAVGAWWTSQDDWDIAPNELTTKAGYLSGFSEDFREVLRPVEVVTYTNTVNDGGDPDTTYDKIWLPSLGEMYINPQIAGEGDPLDYWQDVNGTSTKWAQYGTYPALKHYALENHSSAQSVRLRSAYRGSACNTWFVHSSGYVNYSVASHSWLFAPLAFIG